TAGGTDLTRTVTWAGHDTNDQFGPTGTTEIPVAILPILNKVTFDIAKGGTTVLSNSNFVVTDPGHASFTYSLAQGSVVGGEFRVFNGSNWVSAPTGGFTTAQIAAGHVEFVADGSNTVPNFSIWVSDGSNVSPAIAPTVHFDAPQVVFNQNAAFITFN